jgi:uncharacterized sporulation protein YeaH/YhbH (DUF444 family)
MAILDKRTAGKNKSVGNRQKFIKRYKHRIKDSIDSIASDKGITDVLKDRKIVVDDYEISEPEFSFDISTGERDIILPGNKTLQKGDRIKRPKKSDEDAGTEGSDTGEGMDEFTFTLTKEEFLDLYFSDMALPDFIKESLKGTNKYKFKRSGYSKDGIPPRLDLVKTLKQAMARRIATKSERYLDDIDLRYKHFVKQPFPVKQAVMILLMDVSYSMSQYEKSIAKKFFLLLYLFLHKVYSTVEVIFISHTQDAKEVTEEEFFYGKDSGGTKVSSGLQLAKEIIKDRINLETTNVYLSQASDGDNFPEDDDISSNLVEDLLGMVQYFAYIQTEQPQRSEYKKKRGVKDLMHLYSKLADSHKNMQCRHVESEADVYPVLRDLFEK